jgi:hypothetical protein
MAVFAEYELHAELARYKIRLVLAAVRRCMAKHLLQRYDIRIDLAQNIDNSLRREFPVHPDAFVDIVSCDPNGFHQ